MCVCGGEGCWVDVLGLRRHSRRERERLRQPALTAGVERNRCAFPPPPLFQIETIELPQDPKTEKRRGFVFITYKEEGPVKKVLEKKFHNVSGSKVSRSQEDQMR